MKSLVFRHNYLLVI